MAAEVNPSEIDVVSSKIDALAAELAGVVAEGKRLAKEIAAARTKAGYYATACVTRRICEGHTAWTIGIFVVAPEVFAAAGFILAELLVGNRMLSFAVGAAFGLAGFILVFALLFYPATLVATERLETLRATVRDLVSQYAAIKRQQSVLQTGLSQLTAQRASLQKQSAELARERLRKHQATRQIAHKWRAMRGVAFDNCVAEAFASLGYEVEKPNASDDQGLKLIVTRDQVRISVQVKGYGNRVGNAAVQEAFAGAAHYRCNGCAVITNSRFTSGAKDLARSTGCVLVSEENFQAFVSGELNFAEEARLAGNHRAAAD